MSLLRKARATPNSWIADDHIMYSKLWNKHHVDNVSLNWDRTDDERADETARSTTSMMEPERVKT